MQKGFESALPHFFAQDLRDIFISVSRMNDEREPCFPSRRNMRPENTRCCLARSFVVMIVEASLTNPDATRM